MRLGDLRKNLREEKRLLIAGSALLALAAALILCIMKVDRLWGVVQAISRTLTPVIVGLVLAFILNVFVHFFEDVAFKPFSKSQSKAWKRAKRPLAIFLAYLILLGIIAFISLFIIPGLVQSFSGLAETLRSTVPGTVEAAVNWVTDFAQKNNLGFIQDFIRDFDWSSVLTRVTSVASDFVGSLLNVTFNVATGLFTVVMSFIFSIYMLFGKERLLRGVKATLLAYLPGKTASRLGRIGSMAHQVFFSFVKGQLTECVILGSLCYIGMTILRLDYALLISSIVALGALIPILGAYIGCITGVIILLLVHPIDALIFLIFLLVLQQIEGNLIYPRVVGSSIGLPPVWTLFAVVFWGGMLGIPGILLGTPSTAVIYRLLRSSVHERLRKKGIDPAAPSSSGSKPAGETDEAGPETSEEEAPEAELPAEEPLPEEAGETPAPEDGGPGEEAKED